METISLMCCLIGLGVYKKSNSLMNCESLEYLTLIIFLIISITSDAVFARLTSLGLNYNPININAINNCL